MNPDLKNLRVAVIPSEWDSNQIDQSSSVEDILNCDDVTLYPITDYFKAQNDEELPMHWSFLIDVEKKVDLTGTNIDGIHQFDKAQKIDRIQAIIQRWGAVTSAELELDASPCIMSAGTNKQNVSQLIEVFDLPNVTVITYHNETEVAEHKLDYEDLSEEIIDEIYKIMQQYNEDQEVEYC